MVVQVVQILLNLLFAEDVERIESALPQAILGWIVDDGRQAQAREPRLPTPSFRVGTGLGAHP